MVESENLDSLLNHPSQFYEILLIKIGFYRYIVRVKFDQTRATMLSFAIIQGILSESAAPGAGKGI
jgi:hypothetical protein